MRAWDMKPPEMRASGMMKYAHGGHVAALLMLLTAGLAVPWVVPELLGPLSRLWLFVVLALSWNLLGGQAGYPSLGDIAFPVIGMQVAVMVQAELHEPAMVPGAVAAGGSEALSMPDMVRTFAGLAPGVLAGGVMAALVAIVAGGILLRLPRQHFAVATAALAVAVVGMGAGWPFDSGGNDAPVLPMAAGGPWLLYWWSFLLAALALVFLAWLHASRFRLALVAIRDDEDKAEAAGQFVLRNKVAAWAIAAFFTGMAGAVHAPLAGSTSADMAAFNGLEVGVWMILMVLAGGRGSFWGPVAGAIALFILWELMRLWAPQLQLLLAGVMLVMTAAFLPQGLAGWWRQRFLHLSAVAGACGRGGVMACRHAGVDSDADADTDADADALAGVDHVVAAGSGWREARHV